jgi:pyrophosphatase PpaX
MECGRAAGMRTAAALWGPFERSVLARAHPDHWLEQPGDLLGVLNSPSVHLPFRVSSDPAT